jgi:hypothetical protein
LATVAAALYEMQIFAVLLGLAIQDVANRYCGPARLRRGSPVRDRDATIF